MFLIGEMFSHIKKIVKEIFKNYRWKVIPLNCYSFPVRIGLLKE